jgi:hypothetical protein
LSLRAVVIFLGLLAAAGCAHGHKGGAARAGQPGSAPPAAEAGRPWVLLEQTGGLAGFHNALEVRADGSWTARDLKRRLERSGRFSEAAADSLRALFDSMPAAAWGEFAARAVDDFHYHVSVRHGLTTLTMRGEGSALPEIWGDALRILERPWGELRLLGPGDPGR